MIPNPLYQAIATEFLKIKRTSAMRLVVFMPLIILIISRIWFMHKSNIFSTDINLWEQFINIIFNKWGSIITPIFIAFMTLLLFSLEHSNKNWKHLFALPINRWKIYSAKLIMIHVLTVLYFLFLTIFALTVGIGLCYLRPELGFTNKIPLMFIIVKVFTNICYSLPLIAIFTWSSMRWENYSITAGMGIFLTSITYFEIKDRMITEQLIFLFSNKQFLSIYSVFVINFISDIVISIIGCRDTIRRDVL